MQPIHDVDVLLLLCSAMAAKRRPAELIEIMAAIDLVQGNIPSEDKLSDSLVRLGTAGLLIQAEERVGLTATAEGLIKLLPRRGEHDQRLFELRGLLGAFQPVGEASPVNIAPADLRIAMLAHRSAASTTAKNLLMPKPKTEESQQPRPGQRQRKPMPKARKRAV